ncbi:hypothetical protein PYCCODRAFT_1295418 [Trametes coccinea BRFM310]|uniref:Uncharacterized protein n=1 Tax=Trametes coccinea (strain BRFM310) TaxID=1353009 RepID=A0A1Y2IYX1_TRAC3|nr:hypothetical protein PYCCODRAFT_1295418 [Trametes coccinea BRFM310]
MLTMDTNDSATFLKLAIPAQSEPPQSSHTTNILESSRISIRDNYVARADSRVLSNVEDVTIELEDQDSDTDDERPAEFLPKKIQREALRIHGSTCVLCGSAHALVHRAVLHHGGGRYTDPRLWLEGLGFITSAHDIIKDDLSNLMIVCEDHAKAYDLDIWSFVPAAAIREEMLNTRPPMLGERGAKNEPQPTSSDGTQAVDDPVDDLKNKQEIFDLLIFFPDKMPRIDIRNAPDFNSVAIHKDDLQAGRCPRVLRAFRKLYNNRYLVYAHALPMLNAAYMPLPDADLKDIERDCLAIRNGWNRAVVENRPPPVMNRKLVRHLELYSNRNL